MHQPKLLHSIEIAAPHKGQPTSRRVVVSTATIDRNLRLVEQEWELDAYKANPVVLFAHDGDRLPIGLASNVGVTEPIRGVRRLEAQLEFDTEDNRLAAAVARAWDKGLLRTVSAGWVPVEPPEDKFDEDSGSYLFTRYPRNELLEISVVPIPANPDAQRIAAHLELGQDMADLVMPSPNHRPDRGARTVAAARLQHNRARLARLQRRGTTQ